MSASQTYHFRDKLREGDFAMAVRATAPDTWIGEVLGRYRITAKLGVGGMGEVFRARDQHLQREVAVKLLPAGMLASESARRRFRKEAIALSKLSHPNIATIYDFDSRDGIDFIVMEYIPGLDLEAKLRHGPLSERDAARLALQMSEALEVAHRQGVIHSDLKPGNLRLTADRRLKILDFGLARLRPLAQTSLEAPTATSTVFAGTLAYMAPEQILGEQVDARSDLWSAGVVLYEMATNRLPFAAKPAGITPDVILHAPLHLPTKVRPELSPRLEEIVLKCLERDPSQRYQSAAELGNDLKRLLRDSQAPAPVPPVAGAHAAPALDFYLGAWLVQPSLGVIGNSKTSAHLEPKAMQLLVHLAEHSGEVLSKEDLMGAVWPDTFVTEHVLTHAIWQLRQAFGDSDLLQTVPRRGYRLTASVRPAAARIRSLLVLPLDNLTGDPEQEYLADGMTETLIGTLAQIGALRVISRTSAMHYKSTSKPIPQIARELNVDAVVEGSIGRAGDRVRIAVQLIAGCDDRHLWARSYEGELANVLSLQDQVARAIAAEVQVSLTPAEQVRLSRSRSVVNPEAQLLYMKGRYCHNRASAEGLQMSIGYMQKAISLDPDYPQPYVGLADSLALLASPVAEALPPDEANRLMRPAVERILELDDNVAEGHFLLGWIKVYYEWDWTGAEAAFNRALERNPNYWQAHAGMATLYEALAWREQAIRYWRSACECDPLNFLAQTLLGWTLVLAGRWREAVDQLRATLALEPHYWFSHEVFSMGLAGAGEYEEATAAAETAVRLCPEIFPKGMLAHVYARSGRPEDALRIFADMQELSAAQYVSPALRAHVMAAVGDLNRAFDFMEEGFRQRDPAMIWLKAFPTLWNLPLQQNPHYQDLLHRMHLDD